MVSGPLHLTTADFRSIVDLRPARPEGLHCHRVRRATGKTGVERPANARLRYYRRACGAGLGSDTTFATDARQTGTTVKVATNFAANSGGAQVAASGRSRLVQIAPDSRLVAFDAALTAVCMMWSPQDGRAPD